MTRSRRDAREAAAKLALKSTQYQRARAICEKEQLKPKAFVERFGARDGDFALVTLHGLKKYFKTGDTPGKNVYRTRALTPDEEARLAQWMLGRMAKCNGRGPSAWEAGLRAIEMLEHRRRFGGEKLSPAARTALRAQSLSDAWYEGFKARHPELLVGKAMEAGHAPRELHEAVEAPPFMLEEPAAVA